MQPTRKIAVVENEKCVEGNCAGCRMSDRLMEEERPAIEKLRNNLVQRAARLSGVRRANRQITARAGEWQRFFWGFSWWGLAWPRIFLRNRNPCAAKVWCLSTRCGSGGGAFVRSYLPAGGHEHGELCEPRRMAAQLGLEPRQNESESFVLPLHHWAKN